MKDTPQTVPAPVSAQAQGLGPDDQVVPQYRAFSAPTTNDNMDVLPPNSPDSSDAAGADDDSLSNISEAREMADRSPEGSERGGDGDQVHYDANLPPDTLDRLDLASGSDKNLTGSPGSVPLAPRPGSRSGQGSRAGSRIGSAMSGGSLTNRSNRPGSERHPVLPPIGGQGSPRVVDPLPDY